KPRARPCGLHLEDRPAQLAARHPGRHAAFPDRGPDHLHRWRNDRLAGGTGPGHFAGGPLVSRQRTVRRHRPPWRHRLSQQSSSGPGRAAAAGLAKPLNRRLAMTRRLVDLSIYLENDVMSDPPSATPHIEYFTHESSFEQIARFFPGLKKEDLPDGEGW